MIRAKDINLDTPLEGLTPGGEIYEGGTAAMVNTGSWRTNTPVIDFEKCKHCMLCVPFCPDVAIPVKDAAVLANCPDREVRREWIQRILDHDGFEIGGVKDEGGIEAWIRLGLAVGLTREEITDLRHVIPAVRFAVDAYVNFARHAPWQEAVCSSLTELFAPEIHKQRLATWPEHYGWIETTGLQYFRNRVSQARRDVEQGLAVTLDHFRSRDQQERALEILRFKLDILWAMNDAMAQRYGVQGVGA